MGGAASFLGFVLCEPGELWPGVVKGSLVNYIRWTPRDLLQWTSCNLDSGCLVNKANKIFVAALPPSCEICINLSRTNHELSQEEGSQVSH